MYCTLPYRKDAYTYAHIFCGRRQLRIAFYDEQETVIDYNLTRHPIEILGNFGGILTSKGESGSYFCRFNCSQKQVIKHLDTFRDAETEKRHKETIT